MEYFENIGNVILPKHIRPKIRKYLLKAGINKVPYGFYGFLFHVGVFLAIIIYLIFIFPNIKYNVFILIIGTIFYFVFINMFNILAVGVLLKVYYELRIFKRTEEIEALWPEYLSSVRVNLQSGSTFDKALLDAVETRFGVLEKEIEIVAKKEMTGEDTELALKEFAEKYNSNILNESIDLLAVSIRTGASISDILEKLIESLNLSNYLKKEAASNVLQYVFFVSLIACVISPVLFAMSFNLLTIFQGFGAKIGATASKMLSFSFDVSVNKDHFILFSRFSVTIISLFSAMIIANLKKGSLKGGIKYIPIFIIISLIIYEISRWVLNYAFASLF